jgi:hypothetical protein
MVLIPTLLFAIIAGRHLPFHSFMHLNIGVVKGLKIYLENVRVGLRKDQALIL